MQTRQLEYFVAVAEDLSFTRAAKRFFVSQAALSQQIKLLEKEAGTRLFERDSHHVELTPAGRSLLGDAKTILRYEQESLIRARRRSKGIDGTLAIGYIKGYEHTNLSDMVLSFLTDNPYVTVSFMRENVSELYDALKAETIDVAFNLLYDPSQMEGIEYQVLKHWPLLAVVPAGHPLSGRQTIEFSELKGYELVDIDRGSENYGENSRINTTLEDGPCPQGCLRLPGHRDNCAGRSFGDGICPPTRLLHVVHPRKRQGERYPNRGQGTGDVHRRGMATVSQKRCARCFSRQVPAGGVRSRAR